MSVVREDGRGPEAANSPATCLLQPVEDDDRVVVLGHLAPSTCTGTVMITRQRASHAQRGGARKGRRGEARVSGDLDLGIKRERESGGELVVGCGVTSVEKRARSLRDSG
jgi:hypothetical protein